MKGNFYNISIDITDKKGVLDKCHSYFKSDTNHCIFFLNAHCYNIARKNPRYLKEINDSDLLLNDGIGIKIASKFTGINFKENLNGTDLIPEILQLAGKNGQSVFLLGGMDGIAGMAAERIKGLFPEIKIAGFHSGYFSGEGNQKIIDIINQSGAELLIIGMGVPRQELWASENRNLLKYVKVIIAGGAIIDFLSGNIKRAPIWMRKMSIEWVYRLIIEPRRMWKRYLIGNIQFFYYIFTTRSVKS
jgi:N-acetylglucosaminyldiphosphoundecaprenol N-acetyl-beta-D-mannosaminyltransferase